MFDFLLRWRDRVIARAGFQHWAAAFPLTRPIARRQAAALFDLCAGFVYSQILAACLQLRLFESLAAGPLTVAELARRHDLPEAAMAQLLAGAAALKLLQPRGGPGRYGLGMRGAALLGNPGIAALVAHHAMLYADLADPVALLRQGGGGQVQAYWAYSGAERPADLAADRVDDYSTLMAESQPMIAAGILSAYSLRPHHCLLDIGGGEGVFALAAARRWPHLAVRVFDLPPVAARAESRFAAAGLADRARAIGGDFHHSMPPPEADIVSLVRVIHDHDDAAALQILRQARACLAVGGRLLLAEPMADTPGAEASGAAYFGMYLAAMGSGRPRNPAQLGAMLRQAGFEQPRLLATPMPLLVRVMIATASEIGVNKT